MKRSYLRQPSHYSLPDHLARIARTEAFSSAAATLGLTHGNMQIKLSEELKRVIARHRSTEESAFEEEVAQEAIAAALAGGVA